MRARVEQSRHGQKRVLEACLEPCSIERGMRIIGGKWKGSILWHLKDGPVRFNDLARMLGGASKKMISQRLAEMEEAGLLKRRVINQRPIAVTYEITVFGRSALGVLEELKDWSESQNI
ncbi:MAG: helix-turn-helix domain-containing protein [Pseudomonadota bacterium]